jgi:hypothetical protein
MDSREDGMLTPATPGPYSYAENTEDNGAEFNIFALCNDAAWTPSEGYPMIVRYQADESDGAKNDPDFRCLISD